MTDAFDLHSLTTIVMFAGFALMILSRRVLKTLAGEIGKYVTATDLEAKSPIYMVYNHIWDEAVPLGPKRKYLALNLGLFAVTFGVIVATGAYADSNISLPFIALVAYTAVTAIRTVYKYRAAARQVAS